MLLFALSGLLLLRCADRQLFALLFQLPPRSTRLEPVGRRPKSFQDVRVGEAKLRGQARSQVQLGNERELFETTNALHKLLRAFDEGFQFLPKQLVFQVDYETAGIHLGYPRELIGCALL